MMVDPQQLTKELSRSFTAALDIQALSTLVTYQHVAAASDHDMAWVVEKLHEHAAVVERNVERMHKPQFGREYADRLRRHAAVLADDNGETSPSLQLIQGGRPDGEL